MLPTVGPDGIGIEQTDPLETDQGRELRDDGVPVPEPTTPTNVVAAALGLLIGRQRWIGHRALPSAAPPRRHDSATQYWIQVTKRFHPFPPQCTWTIGDDPRVSSDVRTSDPCRSWSHANGAQLAGVLFHRSVGALINCMPASGVGTDS
jgi:hypothetical protein